MDSGIEAPRQFTQLGKASDTRETLARAKRAVQDAGLKDWLIVDVDAHHFENQSWDQVVECVPNDIVRHAEPAGIILVPGFQRQYRLMVPPSTLKSNPVIISASSEARKIAPLA